MSRNGGRFSPARKNLPQKIFHPSFDARAINAISRLMPQKG
jgi:hypothetical protein